MIPVLQASSPQEHRMKEIPANCFRESAPQYGQPGYFGDTTEETIWLLENAEFEN